MERKRKKTDIAIIGLAGRFPKSDDIKHFWQNLVDGKELVQFYNEEELRAEGVKEELLKHPDFIGAGCFIDNPGHFDHSFFEYTKEEALIMDPQTRIMHEVVWKALEDAGYNAKTDREKIGLYLSASDNFNWKAYESINRDGKIPPFLSARLADRIFISTIISYKLNLKGPSCYTDTACSSSLVSLHLACRALLLKECSMAVAGGISVYSNTDKGYIYQEGMITSKDGYCRAFDKGASGTIWGEGAGGVVLKRLDDAIADKDNIYAVILATAVNNDGKRKVGYTAPSVDGQYECINLAHRIAGVSPESISYMEAHGTGTKLGDPIEIEALNKAFNYNTEEKCTLGTVKSNMGHLDVAAGIAGVIKTTLALKNKVIPPAPNYKEPNPEIDFASGPFYVNSVLEHWENQAGYPLRAGVSSFGIGGTNAHVVLQEAPSYSKSISPRSYQIIPYSAKSNKAFTQYHNLFLDYLQNQEAFELADLAYTMATGRASFRYRNAVIGHNTQEILDQLNDIRREQLENQLPVMPNANRKIVFMFSGQGSQYYQMARQVYESEPRVRKVMDEGFSVLREANGEDWYQIIGYREGGNAQQINETKYAQPLLFLLEYALAQYFITLGIKPRFLIGHSLGEYTAACISGVFTFMDGLRILIKRANLMSQLPPGDMLSVRASSDVIRPLLDVSLSIATINAKDSCVVSGTKASIEALVQRLSELDLACVRLKTSHAFHSIMMDSMLPEFELFLKTIPFRPPQIPFISNLTGSEIKPKEATSTAYWSKHLRHTVHFSKGLDYLAQKGDYIFIEIGPGKTLCSLVHQHKTETFGKSIHNTVRHPKEGIDDYHHLTKAIGNIWAAGVDIDWTTYYKDKDLRRISAPTYPFHHTTFPAKVNPFAAIQQGGLYNLGQGTTCYGKNWKRSYLNLESQESDFSGGYLVFTNGDQLLEDLIDQLRMEGQLVIKVIEDVQFQKREEQLYTLNPQKAEHFGALFQALANEDLKIAQCIYAWNVPGRISQENILAGCHVLGNLGVHFVRHDPFKNKKLTFIQDFSKPVLGNELPDVNLQTIQTLADDFKPIYADLQVCTIDVDTKVTDTRLASKLIAELYYNHSESEIAYRNLNRWVSFWEPLDLKGVVKQVPKREQVVLVTGNFGYLERAIIPFLKEKYDAKVVLIGSKIPYYTLWETELEPTIDDAEQLAVMHDLKEYLDMGILAATYRAEISDKAQLRTLVDEIEQRHGPIKGIIHALSEGDNYRFPEEVDIDLEVVKRLLSPKIQGILNLYDTFKASELDFVWIPLKLSSVFRAGGNGIGTIADTFIQSFIEHHFTELQNWKSTYLDGHDLNKDQLISIFEKAIDLQTTPSLAFSVQNLVNQKGRLSKRGQIEVENDLPGNTDRPIVNADYRAPVNATEEKLCSIWQLFFGFEKIGIDDDFFELGGDSLKAMSLLQQIQKTFDVEIGMQDFYAKPNIKQLAREIDLAVTLVAVQKQVKSNKKNTIKI